MSYEQLMEKRGENEEFRTGKAFKKGRGSMGKLHKKGISKGRKSGKGSKGGKGKKKH